MEFLGKCRVNYFLVLSIRHSAAVRTLIFLWSLRLVDFSLCRIRNLKKFSGREGLNLEDRYE